MQNEAKRQAQEALFMAIKSQAETNMRAALRATEKAELLRDLAEAYRLTAGASVPEGTARKEPSANGTARKPRSADAAPRKEKAAEERPRKRKVADDEGRRAS